jgi:DNA ligase-1
VGRPRFALVLDDLYLISADGFDRQLLTFMRVFEGRLGHGPSLPRASGSARECDVLLSELVATAEAVAATSSRRAKIELLVDLLRRLEPDEIDIAVGFLSGRPPQGKIGIGWASLSAIEVPASAEPSLTVDDLRLALSRVQDTTGAGSSRARGAILSEMLGRATEAESGFVRRLLVGELRQGALEGLMTEAVAKAAGLPAESVRRAVMLSGNLAVTARIALVEGEQGLGAVGLEVFRPILPMLASTAEDLEDALAATGEASVEWKLDGIRIQVHRKGSEVRVFTRNLRDITGAVPEAVAVARAMPASEFVLDGEAIGMREEGLPRMFQETMGRIGRQEEVPESSIVPFFFDCLRLDGADLLDRPLAERVEALSKVAGEWKIPSTFTSKETEAQAVLDAALTAGHEGVVVKSASSTYQAGRRGKAWRKVKIASTLDLVVLGAEWGHGRRRGWLSNLHLGARDPAGGFVMVGKTFKGLTDELLRWQTERFLELETDRSGITVFIRPEVVVEVELDGAQVSTRYPGGVALRFARVKRYRPDKDPGEADTIEAVRALLPG